MRDEIRTLLSRAERSPKWKSNSSEPWGPILSLLEDELEVPADDIHAAKIQKRSAKKSLWQGRLHRVPPVYGLFFAVDEPCNGSVFEGISEEVENRFLSPSIWADACLVFSDGKLIGCVQREGVGLAEWLSPAIDLKCAACDSDQSQLDLITRVGEQVSPSAFLRRISKAVLARDKKGIANYVGDVFKLNKNEVLCSLASEPANAAKNRWEGSDIDPTIRYRVAIVGANQWSWDNAAVELIHRMQPPDLSPGFAILCAKSAEASGWDSFRAFISEGADRVDDLIQILREGGIGDIRLLSTGEKPHAQQSSSLGAESGAALRVRDTDAGEIVYEVSKSKRRIHDFLTNSLLRWAAQEGLQVLEGTNSIAMYDALVRREDGKALLIEVKSSATPGVIRLAVGQLIDYRRVLLRQGNLVDCECVLMLPSNEKLSPEMKELLGELNFAWGTLRERFDSTLVFEIHYSNGDVEEIPRQD